jgi:hypothetical protein
LKVNDEKQQDPDTWDPLVRNTVRGSGSIPKCHGSRTLAGRISKLEKKTREEKKIFVASWMQ